MTTEVSERVAVLETRVERAETTVEAMRVDVRALLLGEAEQKQNQRLTVALGGLLGSLIVGVIVMIAGKLVA